MACWSPTWSRTTCKRSCSLVIHQPPNWTSISRPCANAVGAAIAQVSGEVDRIYTLAKSSREEALADAKQKATDAAIAAGARPDTVQIVDVEDVPLAYLPGNATRVRVKAVGELNI